MPSHLTEQEDRRSMNEPQTVTTSSETYTAAPHSSRRC